MCIHIYMFHICGKQKCLFPNMEPLYLSNTYFPSVGIESLQDRFCKGSIRICLDHQQIVIPAISEFYLIFISFPFFLHLTTFNAVIN